MNRQYVTLNLIKKFNDKGLDKLTIFVKGNFLLKEEYGVADKINFYSFYPYAHGPFSQLLYYDLRKLKNEGLIDESERRTTKRGNGVIEKKADKFDDEIENLTDRFDSYQSIVGYVYSKYGNYTTKSIDITHTKNKSKGGIFTIGYENKDIDSFLDKLIQNGVETIIDVRRNAFSMNFTYIKEKLREYLSKVDIDYMHIPELGIESEQRQNLNARADYDALFSKYKKTLNDKKEHINKIIDIGKNKKVALMCYENDPSFCHRGVLAEYIENIGQGVTNL